MTGRASSRAHMHPSAWHHFPPQPHLPHLPMPKFAARYPPIKRSIATGGAQRHALHLPAAGAHCTVASGCCARHPHACRIALNKTRPLAVWQRAPRSVAGAGAPVRQQATNASRCVHYDDGRKFSCDLAGKDYHEPMAPVDVDVDPFLRAMHGRTVYFVGDSLTRQHFASFCCLIRAEVKAPVPAGIDNT